MAVLVPWIENQDVGLWYLLVLLLLLTWGVLAAGRRWDCSRWHLKAAPSPVGRRLMKEVCYELQVELKLAQDATQPPVDNVPIHHRHVKQMVKDILIPFIALLVSGV